MARRRAATPPKAEHVADAPAPQPLRTVTADSVTTAPQRWLVEPYLPLGSLVVLEGRKGTGKSHVAASWAAHVTGGRPVPGARHALTGPVIWGCGEESAGRDTTPKLRGAGAVLKNVHFLWGIAGDPALPRCVLPGDLGPLGDTVHQHGIRLIVLDPLRSFVSSRVSLIAEQDMGLVCSGLASIADSTGCVILLLRNITKNRLADRIDQGAGSGAIGNIARIVLRCDRGETRTSARLLSVVVANGLPDVPVQRYQIVGDSPESRVDWLDLVADTDQTLGDLLLDAGQLLESRTAEDLIRQELAKGPRHASEVYAAGERERISKGAMWRTATKIGIIPVRRGFGGEGYFEWALPAPEKGGTGAGKVKSMGKRRKKRA